MNKILLGLFLALTSVTLPAQELDLTGVLPVIESVETVPGVDTDLTKEQLVSPVEREESLDIIPLDLDFLDNTKANLEEMNRIKDEIRRIAEEIKKEVPLKMSYEGNLEERLKTVEENYVTKTEVVELVKEEVARQLSITVKTAAGKVEERKVPVVQSQNSMVYNSVSVPGYVGTFKVEPGAVITHIDGQPINTVKSRASNGSSYAYTRNYLLNSQRVNNGWNVRIAQPVRSTSRTFSTVRSLNCADGNCN
jgi:hypothetical protein